MTTPAPFRISSMARNFAETPRQQSPALRDLEWDRTPAPIRSYIHELSRALGFAIMLIVGMYALSYLAPVYRDVCEVMELGGCE